jgi:putative phosphoesterase
MTIGIISDIHGNFEALKKVLAELDRMNVSKVICLGDIVGYYTQVNECCDELRARRVRCVMGNHDWYMAGGGFCLRSKSVNECLIYQRKVITAENVEWLRSFPLQRWIDGLRVVHGGWSDPIDEYLKWTETYFDRIDGTRFASGHTHIQAIRTGGGKTYCNPGSVGQPRDKDPTAAFATYDGEFALHRVEYDTQPVFDLMKAAGFSDYYYGCLKTGASSLCSLPEERGTEGV